MTAVTFSTEGARITGFDVSGHSGYAEAGSDIVCAAITSAVRLAEATVNDVLGLNASVKVRDAAGELSFRLPKSLSEPDEHAVQSLLSGLMLYLTELRDEYPDNIEVMEA